MRTVYIVGQDSKTVKEAEDVSISLPRLASRPPARKDNKNKSLMVRATNGIRRNRERGDVPGWVLITLMTAGLVVAIWAIAGPALEGLFNDAIANISNQAS